MVIDPYLYWEWKEYQFIDTRVIWWNDPSLPVFFDICQIFVNSTEVTHLKMEKEKVQFTFLHFSSFWINVTISWELTKWKYYKNQDKAWLDYNFRYS